MDLVIFLLRFILPRREWYRKYYLRSNHWRRKRKRIIQRAGGLCEACKMQKKLDVHHQPLAYKFLFFEPEFLLTALCRECHGEEHKKG